MHAPRQFLREFVTRPWVHLDIAGTAYYRKETAWAPKGATGVTHVTLVELALGWLLSHPEVGPVIAGASGPEQVRANVAASGWRLSEADMQEVAAL